MLFLQSAFRINLNLTSGEFHDMHEFGVSVDNNIRIMRSDNQLPVIFILVNLFHNQIRNQCVVQVVFRLVDYERLIAITQYKSENCRRLLPSGTSL